MRAYKEALADFDQALDLRTDDWYHYGRALAYRFLNQPDQAQADFDQAIVLARQGLVEIRREITALHRETKKRCVAPCLLGVALCSCLLAACPCYEMAFPIDLDSVPPPARR